MEIVIRECEIAFADLKGSAGVKAIEFRTPAGITFRVILSAEAAQVISENLRGSRILPARPTIIGQ